MYYGRWDLQCTWQECGFGHGSGVCRGVIISGGNYTSPALPFQNRASRIWAERNRVHIVNIVTLPSGSKYMLDVGFGGDGATKPLPLISGHITQNLGSQQVRLLHGTIPQQLDQSQKLWIYQYRNREEQEWNSFFAFPETEFLPMDFEVMSFYTSQHQGGTNFQTRTVLVIRFLLGEREGREEVVGKVMLVNGDVKRNDGGRTRVVEVCRTEDDRVRALREHFEIELTEEEILGIKGRNVELREEEYE